MTRWTGWPRRRLRWWRLKRRSLLRCKLCLWRQWRSRCTHGLRREDTRWPSTKFWLHWQIGEEPTVGFRCRRWLSRRSSGGRGRWSDGCIGKVWHRRRSVVTGRSAGLVETAAPWGRCWHLRRRLARSQWCTSPGLYYFHRQIVRGLVSALRLIDKTLRTRQSWSLRFLTGNRLVVNIEKSC